MAIAAPAKSPRAIDNLYAFAATSGLVSDAQFELAFSATLGDERLRDFISRENPRAYESIVHAFSDALARELWRTRRNSVRALLEMVGGAHAADA